MSRKKTVSSEESALFRTSIGEVRPLRSNRKDPHTGGARPEPVQRLADEAAVMADLLDHPLEPADLEIGEELLYLKPGLQKRILQRLRRGHFSVQDTLDLHHMDQNTASNSLLEFIQYAQEQTYTCIKVIHGKGLRSGPDGPRLKTLANRLLRRHRSVLAFASARPNDGGTGAVYILLERWRPSRLTHV